MKFPFCFNGPLEKKLPGSSGLLHPCPREVEHYLAPRFTGPIAVVFVKGFQTFTTFTGHFFPEMGPTRDTFPKKMPSKYGSTFVYTTIQILDQKTHKNENNWFQIIFFEISDLQSAIKTLRPIEFFGSG